MTSSFPGKRLLQPQTVGAVRNLVAPQREFSALIDDAEAVTVRTDDGLVSGRILGPELTTYYAFRAQGQMTDNFASLFRDMLNRARERASLDRVVLTLEDNPSRPWAEPVYAEVGFRHLYEWVRMSLQEPANWKPSEEIEQTLTIRDAGEADLQTIADIDAECFGDQCWGVAGQRALLKSLAWTAIAESNGRPVGYIQLRRTPENIGEIFELAVRPSERGKRYGSQMLERALRWLGEADVRRAEVTVPTDQPASLDLMRRFGFVAQRSGNTYRRPADDRAVEAAAEEAKKRSFLIQFGDWR